jgi:hypothetical protein
MEQPLNEQSVNTESTPAESTIDPRKLEELMSRLREEESLVKGIIGGLVAALVGAAIWATVTVVTNYQIGWMAVGVGFLVGFAVRYTGKGLSMPFGIIGGVCALLGCVGGNVLSICGFISNQESVPLLQVIVNLAQKPNVIVELLTETFNPMDLLFYGIAVYEGYKFSFRQISEQELASVTGPA